MTLVLAFCAACIAIQFVAMGLMLYEAIRLTLENRMLRVDKAAILALYDAATYNRRGLHKSCIKTHDYDYGGKPLPVVCKKIGAKVG